jgi:hypothetical protein
VVALVVVAVAVALVVVVVVVAVAAAARVAVWIVNDMALFESEAFFRVLLLVVIENGLIHRCAVGRIVLVVSPELDVFSCEEMFVAKRVTLFVEVAMMWSLSMMWWLPSPSLLMWYPELATLIGVPVWS